MKITVEQLKKLKACQPQLDLFEKLGLDGVEITEELCVKHAQDFDWDWASERLLCRSALEEYKRVMGLAWEEYERVIGPAWGEYNLIRAKAFFAATLTIPTA